MNDIETLPNDAVIIVPVRNTLLFPGVVLPLALGRPLSIAAAQTAAQHQRPFAVLLQRDPATEVPGADDLYSVGTAAGLLRYVTGPDGTHHIVVQGEQRIRIVEFLEGRSYLAARVERLSELAGDTTEAEARLLQLKERSMEALALLPQAPEQLGNAIQSITIPSQGADMVASFMDLKPEERQELLEELNVERRLDKILGHLGRRIEVLKLSRDIGEQTKETLEGQQREYFLRQQLKTIQRELGEDDEKAEIKEIGEAVENSGMPEEVLLHARKELRRLERMPEAAGEYSMLRAYLEWLIELPWSKQSEDVIDIAKARQVLDEDHFGLEKIKRRILEYLAVRKLNPSGKSPILCFVGPPGVGKTSLGRSIARAMGREFVRASLGGLHDEAEIRGHRRTYLGALPGNIIQGIRKAGTRNPVFMLDEMDKLGAGGFHGDPSSALLEVLDPAQNDSFRDNYLAVPFDLSQVMFIATANVLDAIPGPLRDRMEIIELPSYVEEEKLEIARRYLIARQLEANGLRAEQAVIEPAALKAIVSDYTREAGVRNLERMIGAVLRHAAMRIAEGQVEKVDVGPGALHAILGPKRVEPEVAMRTAVAGVATGLAWTPVGGDILFVEATRVPGKGQLILTGQLGEVMKESAQAALSLVKSKARRLDIDQALFDGSDIHIHVPAGAIPKDGPSAGVAMFTALASLLRNETVRADTAMTGEISLRGLVLPVGGIKEKVLAAHRAGIHRVMLPARNRKDFEDIPESARLDLDFVWLEDVDDAVEAALGEPGETRRQSEQLQPAAQFEYGLRPQSDERGIADDR